MVLEGIMLVDRTGGSILSFFACSWPIRTHLVERKIARVPPLALSYAFNAHQNISDQRSERGEGEAKIPPRYLYTLKRYFDA